ncbi:MAG: hypothetical protein ABSA93_16965 [Streptosporangiaceae bacterium]|jgi:uncharacterized protein YukE
MRVDGGGPELSPTQLDDLAAEMRGYAQQLRALVPNYEATLQPVLDLDNSLTWSGSYSEQASAQINGWQKSLGTGSATLQALADSWDTLAQQIQDAATATATTGAAA